MHHNTIITSTLIHTLEVHSLFKNFQNNHGYLNVCQGYLLDCDMLGSGHIHDQCCPFMSSGATHYSTIPCLGYLRNPGPSVPAPYCNGIKGLNNQVKTTHDRQSVCRCLKSTALSLSGLNLPAALLLFLESVVSTCPIKLVPPLTATRMYMFEHWCKVGRKLED
ncbi:putative plant lipid transfer protein/Par allergen [Medicago truncatula]|uniref:Non-specific lipid-transfer protein, putative n=1 Tax=Medicago truncatula TaxID=3880 RepID=A0A072UBN2_MEDTR|nr:Non-specific lipid-transfer protein, putative [Medicago truncatula]RHN46670.1 putative plant lipid transfer protein/Par allergen [Medicago truncatula]